MQLEVLLQVALRGVALQAEVALEGLVARVGSQVDQEVGLALVLLVAVLVVAAELAALAPLGALDGLAVTFLNFSVTAFDLAILGL